MGRYPDPNKKTYKAILVEKTVYELMLKLKPDNTSWSSFIKDNILVTNKEKIKKFNIEVQQ